MLLVSLLLITFSKGHAFPLSVTYYKRCIPLLNTCGIRRCTGPFSLFYFLILLNVLVYASINLKRT
jgi:hypothetical protein